MHIGYKSINERFTSRVTLDRPKLAIDVEYIDGPFKQLENRWRFRPDGDTHCNVDFYISYEFRSRTLGLLMGSVFDKAFHKLSEAFEERADALYGRSAPVASQ